MRYVMLFAIALAVQAQRPPIYSEGTKPKVSPEEYQVYARSGNLEIGAEYMVHSFGSGEQMYIAENYLVVEVALYPPPKTGITANASSFSLRVNGKKVLLYTRNPTMVASDLNQRDWSSPRGPTADLGVGGVNVGMGYPQGGQRVPGAPDERRRLPTPPRAPDAGAPGSGEPREVVRAEDVLIRTALPEDLHPGAVSGFIYFPYTGKASGLKSIELLFQDAVLKLK